MAVQVVNDPDSNWMVTFYDISAKMVTQTHIYNLMGWLNVNSAQVIVISINNLAFGPLPAKDSDFSFHSDGGFDDEPSGGLHPFDFIDNWVRQGGDPSAKIFLIKEVRNAFHIGLKEAKDHVDAWSSGRRLPHGGRF